MLSSRRRQCTAIAEWMQSHAVAWIRYALPRLVRYAHYWSSVANASGGFSASDAPPVTDLTADDGYAPAVSMRFTPNVIATTLRQPCSIQRTGSRAVLVHGVTEML